MQALWTVRPVSIRVKRRNGFVGVLQREGISDMECHAARIPHNTYTNIMQVVCA